MSARRCAPLLLALLAACGGAAPAVAPVGVAPRTGEVELEESGGRRLAVLPFPGSGLVHVSLWIDAGSRDADPPMLATLAAEVAAEAAGGDVRTWVSPDGIELSTMGEADEVGDLLGRLGRALAVRRVDPAKVAERAAALERRGDRARADVARTASALSLSALLGEGAAGLFPLGEPDHEAPGSADVERFLAAHFGAERTLAVIAGDVERAVARAAWSRASEEWPGAIAMRAERDPLEGRFEVEVAVDRGDAVAVTALLPSIELALAARGIVEASDVAPNTESFAYAVRGGALLSVVVTDAPPNAERAMILALLRAVDAAAPTAPRASWATSPTDAAHQVGLRWSTRAPERLGAFGVGVGAVVVGGRGDDLSSDDPDRALRARATEALAESLAWARAAARPETQPADGEPGFASTSNGARLRAAETPPGSPFGLTIAFEGAVAEEPPDAQGRTALVAEALAARCARGLGEGAAVRSFVEGGAFGASLEALPEGWAEAASRFLACVLGAELDARSIEDARIALASRIESDPDADVLAAVSTAIAPRSPSLVWPLGTRTSIERVRVEGVASALGRARVGRRVRAAVVGPIPAEATARFVASTLGTLPAGEPARADAPGTPERGPIALESPAAFVVAAVRLPPGPSTDARAYADAWADALGAAGYRVGVATGGGGSWGRWAAVRIDGASADVPSMAQAARSVLPTASRFAERATERARARRWAEGRPGAFAVMAVPGAPAAREPERALPTPAATVLLVGRDQPDAAYERLDRAR